MHVALFTEANVLIEGKCIFQSFSQLLTIHHFNIFYALAWG